MRQGSTAEQALHALLRPGFGLALLAAQFVSRREGFFTQSVLALAIGGACLCGSIALWISASIHCTRATHAGRMATTGPYSVIRPPIYASALLLALSLGLVFFMWGHLPVLGAFVPLWWLESKSEERSMREKFGPLYEEYRKGKAMLIPGIL